MAKYNYNILTLPALPRSKRRRERNISTTGGSTARVVGSNAEDNDLTEYVRWENVIKTEDETQNYLDSNLMSSALMFKLLDEHDHRDKLIRPSVLLIPKGKPDTQRFDIEEDEMAMYFGSGSYPEVSGGGVADVYRLILQRNGIQIGVFDAGVADAIINIEVPTKVSDLLNDSGFLTSSALTPYALKSDVEAIRSGYLPLTGGTLTGALTVPDSGSADIGANVRTIGLNIGTGGHIGYNSGVSPNILGIYSGGKIVLRPNGIATLKGVEITSDKLLFNQEEVALKKDLADYATESYVTTALASYATKSYVDSAVSGMDLSKYLPTINNLSGATEAQLGWSKFGYLILTQTSKGIYTRINLRLHSPDDRSYIDFYNSTDEVDWGNIGIYDGFIRLWHLASARGLGISNDGLPIYMTSAKGGYELWHKGNLTKVSQLTNDSGYITEHQSLALYALKSDIPTKLSELDNDILSSWALQRTKPLYEYAEIVNAPNVSQMITDALSSYATTDSVQTLLAGYLPLTGGTMSGSITLSSKTAKIRYDNGTRAWDLLQVTNDTGTIMTQIGMSVASDFDRTANKATFTSLKYVGYQHYMYYGYTDTGNYILLTYAGTLQRLRNVTPLSTGTYSLGTTSLQWKTIYAQTFQTTLSGFGVVLGNGTQIGVKNAAGTNRNALWMTTTDDLSIGEGTARYGSGTIIRGGGDKGIQLQLFTTKWGDIVSLTGDNVLSGLTQIVPTGSASALGSATNQWITGYIQSLTSTSVEASGTLIIPSQAPTTVDNSKVYLYISTNGSYAE